jgi:hypothetical protein
MHVSRAWLWIGLLSVCCVVAPDAFVRAADSCGNSAASMGATGQCRASCCDAANSCDYDATTGKLFQSNPCATGSGNKKRCCLTRGEDLCKILGKRIGEVNEVTCVTKMSAKDLAAQGYRPLKGSGFSGGNELQSACPNGKVCVAKAASCSDAVQKIGHIENAKCLDPENVPATGYFNADALLKNSKVDYRCEPSGTLCFVKSLTNSSYYCGKLGELGGVKGAKCVTPTNGNPSDDPTAICGTIGANWSPLTTEPKSDPCGAAQIGTVCCGPKTVTPTKSTATEKPLTTVTAYGLKNPLGNRSVPTILGRLAAWMGGLGGSLFFFYLIWGGLEWMTAGGDSTKVKQGVKRIVAAVTGILVILLAYIAIESLFGLIPH